MASKRNRGIANEFSATVNSADASGSVTIRAATTGKKMRITDIVISADTAMNYQIEDEDSTAIIENLYVPANHVWSKTFDCALTVSTGKAVQITSSTSGNISVTICGYEE